MNDLEERYDIRTAAAWLLGHGRRTGIPALPECMRQKTADECTDDELIQIVTAGQEGKDNSSRLALKLRWMLLIDFL